jgi:hypothetical protein
MEETQAAEPLYEHSWGPHKEGVKAKGYSWSRCRHCRIIKLYEGVPGRPGVSRYFDPDGKAEIELPGACMKPKQPSPYS